ncbi:hypothetical protein glysoja_038508 [Glycine soja]|uniref:Uncharacterized protein n=1 Tax=Glycine soja TaxID=3848 RepID=A0A0B2S6U5_GLYSO|nr:hypothetical protein glysoja_038508 [Glycine soja]
MQIEVKIKNNNDQILNDHHMCPNKNVLARSMSLKYVSISTQNVCSITQQRSTSNNCNTIHQNA